MSSRGMHHCTVLAFQRVRPDKVADFLRIQEEVSATMSRFPGFLGKEVVHPLAGLQEEFVSVFRFGSSEALRGWMESAERRRMIGELDSCADGPGRLQVVAGEDEGKSHVTVVFSHRVRPGRETEFRAWREDVMREMATRAGFLGADIFDPRGTLQEDWVLIVRFDSAADLEGWMGSAKRTAFVARLMPLVERFSAHPLGSGLGGWFSFDDGPSELSGPPRWKQILMVTLGLYPTVMLLGLVLDPWLVEMPLPVRMILLNVICVTVLSWPLMPWLNRCFGRWLSQRAERAWPAQAAGGLIVVILLAGLVALFLLTGAWKN